MSLTYSSGRVERDDVYDRAWEIEPSTTLFFKLQVFHYHSLDSRKRILPLGKVKKIMEKLRGVDFKIIRSLQNHSKAIYFLITTLLS